MSKKEPCFILNLDMDTEIFQEDILNIRMEVARKILNRCLYIMEQNLNKMKEDSLYIQWLKEPKSEIRTEALKSIRESYDLSKTGAERIVKDIAKEYVRQAKPKKRNKKKKEMVMPNGKTKKVRQKRKKEETKQPHIDSATAQALSVRAWEAIESVLFGKGKQVRYKKFGQLNSIESKSNASGIRYVGNGLLEWNGLSIKINIDKNDKYAEKALHHEIAFCRIVRKAVRGKYKFYLQLILKGIPPQKYQRGKGKAGIDHGISTMAYVTKNGVRIEELAEGIESLEKEIRVLKRKLDRSRRATNPNNYNADGTVKKGVRKWVRSKTYIRTLFQLKEMERKLAVKREMSHNKQANQLLKECDDVYVEDMNYKAYQKTWYGKQIKKKAPAKLLEIIDRKLKYEGKKLNKINTRKAKASQYDFFSNTFKKKKLSHRFHVTDDGYVIQRDIYSAFLIYNVADCLTQINQLACVRNFEEFYFQYLKEKERIQKSQKNQPKSIGL